MTERSGKGAGKRKLVSKAGISETADEAPTRPGEKDEGVIDARAQLTRMISELNEVQMRLDAIVRRLVESAGEAEDADTAAQMESMRLRLLGKLDRIRGRLVTRLGEERRTNDH